MAIYSEPEFSAQEISSIQHETAVEVLTLDPLGGPSIDGYRTYQEMMQSNLKTLVKGQGLETMAPPEMSLSMPKPGGGIATGVDRFRPRHAAQGSVDDEAAEGEGAAGSLFRSGFAISPHRSDRARSARSHSEARRTRSPSSPFQP